MAKNIMYCVYIYTINVEYKVTDVNTTKDSTDVSEEGRPCVRGSNPVVSSLLKRDSST